MKTSEIRDLLMRQKTLYEQSLQASEAAVESIKLQLNQITPEMSIRLSEIGFDTIWLKQVDLERIKLDRIYAVACNDKVKLLCESLRGFLEEALHV